jgi:hypothetical protein
MNYKFLPLFILILATSPMVAQACRTSSDPKTLEYSRRDGNRCEGLFDRPASNLISLVSLSTGFSKQSVYPSILSIQIPTRDNTRPTITIQSSHRNYRLDDLSTIPNAKGFIFHLNTRILTQANVPPPSLQALAYTIRDSQRVYIPVILGQPTGQYEFIVKSNQRVTLPAFEIRHNDKVIYQKESVIPGFTHKLTWNYGSRPQGIYKLRTVDNRGQTRIYTFKHTPSLL